MPNKKEVYSTAARLIRERGWMQASNPDTCDGGRKCLFTSVEAAVVEALDDERFSMSVLYEFTDEIGDFLGLEKDQDPNWKHYSFSDIFAWNDTRESEDEVLEVLEALALMHSSPSIP